jgi:hypothetical protein
MTEFAVKMVRPSWSRRRNEVSRKLLSSCFSCSSIDSKSSLDLDVEVARTVFGIVQLHTLSDCTNVQKTSNVRTGTGTFLCAKQH